MESSSSSEIKAAGMPHRVAKAWNLQNLDAVQHMPILLLLSSTYLELGLPLSDVQSMVIPVVVIWHDA